MGESGEGAPMPRTPDELHAWIQKELGVAVARRALVSGHSDPFRYICHSFFEDRSPRDCVVWANRGGGKTFLGALATLLDLLYKPGIEVRILGGSMDQSRRMYAHLRRLFDPGRNAWLAGQVKGRITERRLELRNGSEVELLAQSQASVRGTRVQKLRCDEVDLFDPEVWEAAQLATRSKVCDGVEVHGAVECLSTMHRPYGVMHRLVREARAGGRAVFRWGVVDVLGACGDEHACVRKGEAAGEGEVRCPLWEECRGRAKARAGSAGHVSVRDAISMKGRVSLATWESEMLCLRPRRTDSVIPEFDPAVHVFSGEGGEAAAWVAGMDFGFRAPTVVVLGRVDGRGVLWIEHERVACEQVLAAHIRAIREGIAPGAPCPAWIGADPAGLNAGDQTGKGNIPVMREAGLRVHARRMSVQDGLGLVRARLRPASGEPRLFVHARCATLIESLEKYHYDPDRPESQAPVKDGPDHAVDALRYLVQNLDRPVKTITMDYLHGRRLR